MTIPFSNFILDTFTFDSMCDPTIKKIKISVVSASNGSIAGWLTVSDNYGVYISPNYINGNSEWLLRDCNLYSSKFPGKRALSEKYWFLSGNELSISDEGSVYTPLRLVSGPDGFALLRETTKKIVTETPFASHGEIISGKGDDGLWMDRFRTALNYDTASSAPYALSFSFSSSTMSSLKQKSSNIDIIILLGLLGVILLSKN